MLGVKEAVHELAPSTAEPDRVTVVLVPGVPPVFEEIVNVALYVPTDVGA